MAMRMAYDSGMSVSLVSSFVSGLSPSFIHWCSSWMQNDLVHGWGLDFALRKCVEVFIYLSSNSLVKSNQLSYLATLSFWTSLLSCCAQSQPAHEKIGVVDSQWIAHQVVPSLGNQVIRSSTTKKTF